jgi:MFS family permease
VQYNFTCAPKWQLGLIGAVFLIGIVIGCSTVTKLGDYYGRRPVYLFGLVLNFVLIGILIIAKNVIIAYFCLFLLGISITARYYVGYTFNLEF